MPFGVQPSGSSSSGGGGGGGSTGMPITTFLATSPSEVFTAVPGINSVDVSSFNCVINLPAGATIGDSYWVKDIAGNSSAKPIAVVALGGKVIDGSLETFVMINIDFDARQFVCNGDVWIMI